MRRVRTVGIVGLSMVTLLGLGACSQSQPDSTTSTPSIEEKMFALVPAKATVTASFLRGDFEDLRVYERVEHGTGKIAEPPSYGGASR
jgi:hypothetical protein